MSGKANKGNELEERSAEKRRNGDGELEDNGKMKMKGA